MLFADRGNQDEEIHEAGADGIRPARRRPLAPGRHFALLLPSDDVHRVRTTSAGTSVSPAT